eukprot:CAMPEP_0180065380 /NCGR_PEP_ID=MMETSP0985-20121206/8708_1 /TAXON_ID=483367 /ORGANISM="non described non described, Strain CCMP 2436" /LENGTH=134 /DNA_ID=CAMNT_0021995793 /DNA_START=9 /DNA_END=413 /DNA_ORIENTATION=-
MICMFVLRHDGWSVNDLVRHGLRDGRRIESDGRLSENLAVERGSGLEAGKGLHKEDALKDRGGASLDGSGHLPYDVLGHGTALEDDLRATARFDAASGLQDENVGGAARDGEVGVEQNVGAPRVNARREGRAAN